MSLQGSLAEHIGSLPGGDTPASPSQDPSPSPESPQQTTPEGQGGQPAPEQQPQIKPIGVKDNQEAQQEKPEEGQQPFTLAQGVAPDMVIGTGPDGKPITAAEVSQGYLRQADYTRKTQEMAAFRQKAEPAVQFVTDNWSYIERLSNDNEDVRAEAVLEIAKSNDVDLGKYVANGLSQQNTRQRDAQGRFVAGQQQQQAGVIDLNQYEEGSEAWELANALNQEREHRAGLETRLDQLGGKLDNFFSAQERQTQQQQARTAMQATAQEWAGAGMQGVDVDAAMALVGQPMTPEGAMIIHHFQMILQHQLAAAGAMRAQQPNEPGNNPSGQRISPGGMGLHEYISQSTPR